jgi:hypothetical protein
MFLWLKEQISILANIHEKLHEAIQKSFSAENVILRAKGLSYLRKNSNRTIRLKQLMRVAIST